jgi:hypothetical protein
MLRRWGDQPSSLIPACEHEGHYGMLPILEDVLHLRDIAEYWSRELQRVRTQSEIYVQLLSGFRQGKVAAVFVHVHPIDRQSVLKGINSTRKSVPDHPGFTLVDSAEEIPPRVVLHPDGSATIDQTFYIVLPSNDQDWTDETLNAAYDKFATLTLDDFQSS